MPRPPRQTARDFDPRVMQLFDQYVHGLIDRRGFLQGASALAFSVIIVGGQEMAGQIAGRHDLAFDIHWARPVVLNNVRVHA